MQQYNKLFSVVFLLALFLMPLTSAAVTFNSGSVINTSVSNSSLTFNGCSATVDEITIRTVEINLYNLTTTESQVAYTFPAFINYTTENFNVDCSSFDSTFGIAVDQTESACFESISSFEAAIPMIGLLLLVICVSMIILYLSFSGTIDFKTAIISFVIVGVLFILMILLIFTFSALCSSLV